MGRYYDGDIEGKFAFGIQDSDDASFFGVEAHEPCTIEYSFESDDLKKVEEGIEKCKKLMGKHKEKLDKAFKEKKNIEISELLGIDEEEALLCLKWYYRLGLGIKIRDCIKKIGHCYFTAEL